MGRQAEDVSRGMHNSAELFCFIFNGSIQWHCFVGSKEVARY